MALPIIEAGDNKEVGKVVTEIGQAIFKRASVSIQAAAKSVVPDIPEMVKDITEDLRAGPVTRFSQGIEKLDKLIEHLGVNISDYSKELADFLQTREQNIQKSDAALNELRTEGIIAQLDEFGQINILTRKEIRDQEKELKGLNKEIADNRNKLEKLGKTRQEDGDARRAQQKTILKTTETIIQKEAEREKILTTLNKTEERAPATFREKYDSIVEKYVPDQLRDIGSAFMEGLTAPFTAVKELGMMFGSLLKPLRALPKLLGGFITGMIGAVASMLPFILITAGIILGLILLYKAFQYLKTNIDMIRMKLSSFATRIKSVATSIKDWFKEKFEKLATMWTNFIDEIKLVPGKIQKWFDEKFEILKESFTAFGDFVKGIPERIKGFLSKQFDKINDFFITAINSVLELINKIKPGKDLELLETTAQKKEKLADLKHDPEFTSTEMGEGQIHGNEFGGIVTAARSKLVSDAKMPSGPEIGGGMIPGPVQGAIYQSYYMDNKQHIRADSSNILAGSLGAKDDDDILKYAYMYGASSDIRLKEDIKLEGKSPSNINIYSFKYKNKEGRYKGVMAQDVPWASFEDNNGYLMVDYSKLDVDFVKI